MSDSSNRLLAVHGVQNLRDVGGLVTADGRRMREGRLFRSAQLADSGPQMLEELSKLGIGLVFDLRTEHEIDLLPDFVPDNVEHVHLDVLSATEESVAARLEDLFTDISLAEEILGSGAVEEHYVSTYREFVSLDSAISSYRELFTRLATDEQVALFHCTAGKDRTGWAAAALQTLMGVDNETVLVDYLLSNEPVRELFRSILDQFAAAGGNSALLEPVFGVEQIYLDAALDEVNTQFGSIEGYFREGLGLDAELLDSLRRRFLP